MSRNSYAVAKRALAAVKQLDQDVAAVSRLVRAARQVQRGAASTGSLAAAGFRSTASPPRWSRVLEHPYSRTQLNVAYDVQHNVLAIAARDSYGTMEVLATVDKAGTRLRPGTKFDYWRRVLAKALR